MDAQCPAFQLSLDLPISTTAETLAPDTLLAGRYQILRTIHQGGMSVVYLAEDRTQRQQVALKELRLPAGASAQERQEAEAWFARESYLLSSLRMAGDILGGKRETVIAPWREQLARFWRR